MITMTELLMNITSIFRVIYIASISATIAIATVVAVTVIVAATVAMSLVVISTSITRTVTSSSSRKIRK